MAAQVWPELGVAHQQFLVRHGDVLHVKELPSRDTSRPPPSTQLLAELHAVIERLAQVDPTHDNDRGRQPLMQMTSDLAAAADDAGIVLNTRAATKIRRLVCRYETQQNDELVEECMIIKLEKTSELTVPHTHWGLVAYAIGAFLPHCTHLQTLKVHTCDHARLRQVIHKIPTLELTVIKNDCSNGFWNTASLALFAQLRREDQVERVSAATSKRGGYNAVVVAHTNSHTGFSAPEWALATYLFMRDQVADDERRRRDALPTPGGRHVLHDFASDAARVEFDAAYAIVQCRASDAKTATFPQIIRDGRSLPLVLKQYVPARTTANPGAPVLQRTFTVERLGYSSLSPNEIRLVPCGRNVFIPYIEQFDSCPNARIEVGSDREPADGILRCIYLGINMHFRKIDSYGAEHELLFLKYRDMLHSDQVYISERNTYAAAPSGPDGVAEQVSMVLVEKLRKTIQDVKLAHVTIRTGQYGLLATRVLMAECEAERLTVVVDCENDDDGTNHDNPTYGDENNDVLQDILPQNPNAEVGGQRVRRWNNDIQDRCNLIIDMRRIDHLDLTLNHIRMDPESMRIASNQMKRLLNAVFIAPCGITSLSIQNLPQRIACVSMLHMLRRTDACLLMHLELGVRTTLDSDDVAADDHVETILIRNELDTNRQMGVVCRQLLSLSITQLATREGDLMRLQYLSRVITVCTSLLHLRVDLRNVETADRHDIQNAILEVAGRLRSCQLQLDSDSMPDGRSSFTAEVLHRLRDAVFVSIEVDEVAHGINEITDALTACISRHQTAQINITCHRHDAFDAAKLRALQTAAALPEGPGVGLLFRANFEVNRRSRQNAELGLVSRGNVNAPPVDNSAYVAASIEDELRSLSMHEYTDANLEDTFAQMSISREKREKDDEKMAAARIRNEPLNLRRREYLARVGAYQLRELIASSDEPTEEEVRLASELNAAKIESERYQIQAYIDEKVRVMVAGDAADEHKRERHPDWRLSKTRLGEALLQTDNFERKSGGAPALHDVGTLDPLRLKAALVAQHEDDQRFVDTSRRHEADLSLDETRRVMRTKITQMPIEPEVTGRRGGYVPFDGEHRLLTAADRETMSLNPENGAIMRGDPRGDIVLMTRQQHETAQSLLRIDQIHRLLWLYKISDIIRTHPETTTDFKNFAPEVQMAASRAAYQAYSQAFKGTPGCIPFGRFFDQPAGFALVGFPTPGSRPHDSNADFRLCRYFPDIVPGPRTAFVIGQRRLPAIAYQTDSQGNIFGNENARYPDPPARYASGAQMHSTQMPSTATILLTEIANGLSGRESVDKLLVRLQQAAAQFPDGVSVFWRCV